MEEGEGRQSSTWNSRNDIFTTHCYNRQIHLVSVRGTERRSHYPNDIFNIDDNLPPKLH